MSSELDCRGLACPQPVIKAKRALDAMAEGVLTVIVDNEAAKQNVTKFAVANRCGVSVEADGTAWRLRITKGAGAAVAGERTHGQDKAPDESPGIFLITKATLGHGDDDLGAILMKAFLISLREHKPAPGALLFLNSGVRLTVEDSPVLEHLRALADAGTEILSCGTCLDFFGLKGKLAVGSVTNMYSIVSTISAGKTTTL